MNHITPLRAKTVTMPLVLAGVALIIRNTGIDAHETTPRDLNPAATP